MTTFRIAPHSVEHGRAAVEVIGEDGALLAVLYAPNDQRLRLVSKHLDGVVVHHSYPDTAEITLRKP